MRPHIIPVVLPRVGAFSAPLLVAPAAHAEQGVFHPVRDTTIYESATGAVSNGAGTGMFAGVAGNGLARRAFVAFDLASIPRGAVVTGVTLRLHMSMTHAIATPVVLRRALASWGEAGSVASQGQGGGAAAMPGDATWLHRFFDDTAWAAPGGDFSPSASASTIIGGFGAYQWQSPALVADVQVFVNFPQTNHGWALVGDETFAPSAKRFDTRESADPTVRPRLVVEFLPACPGDANADRVVDFLDLNAVLSQFGQSGVGLEGDVNYDGSIDFPDLNIVLGAFGSSC